MPSDRLIAHLASDLKPVRRRRASVDALILAGLGAVEVAVFLGLGFMRPDMNAAMCLPTFWWKLGSLGVIAAVGMGVAIASFDPVRSPRRGLRWVGAIVAACLAAGWLLDAARDGAPALVARLDWPAGLHCVAKMVALSVPAVIALGVLMRRGAATDQAGSALAAGIAAAAWGAFVFVFACPFDDPLYIAVWYLMGCSLVTAFARLVLPRMARW
jgi:hypothetical protein